VVREAEARVREANAGLERRVAERTAELEAANRELESFAYSVSHDLRGPLRTIVSFSGMLLADHGDRLDAAGLDALRRVCASGRRMSELIDALLALSRIGRQEMRHEGVDVSALALAILEGLREGEPGRDVAVSVAPGLEARADRALLRVVLENLLGNAWKYSAGRPGARIEVRATTGADGARWFTVRDNGAGFDMAHADQLFLPFRRLHSEREFPGHGIGLATVARIVRRHGGAVRAEGRVGDGAAFSFTLEPPPVGAPPA
jgi:light-regulated signal transduction histidine kinase (bacteriophytochrome)